MKITLLEKILHPFASYKKQKASESWRAVDSICGRWCKSNEDKSVTGHVNFILMENDLGERNCKTTSTINVDFKTHHIYTNTIFPWLHGLDLESLPHFFITQSQINKKNGIKTPIYKKVALKENKKIKAKVKQIGNVIVGNFPVKKS